MNILLFLDEVPAAQRITAAWQRSSLATPFVVAALRAAGVAAASVRGETHRAPGGPVGPPETAGLRAPVGWQPSSLCDAGGHQVGMHKLRLFVKACSARSDPILPLLPFPRFPSYPRRERSMLMPHLRDKILPTLILNIDTKLILNPGTMLILNTGTTLIMNTGK